GTVLPAPVVLTICVVIEKNAFPAFCTVKLICVPGTGVSEPSAEKPPSVFWMPSTTSTAAEGGGAEGPWCCTVSARGTSVFALIVAGKPRPLAEQNSPAEIPRRMTSTVWEPAARTRGQCADTGMKNSATPAANV